MSLKEVFQEALDELEWADEIRHDDSDNSNYVNTLFGIDGQIYALLISTHEYSKTIKLYLTSPIRIPKARSKEGAYVLNYFNCCIPFGNLESSEEGSVYYRWCIDVEGTTPSTKQFLNMINAATRSFSELRVAAIGAAAFSKNPVEEILREYNEAVNNLLSMPAVLAS